MMLHIANLCGEYAWYTSIDLRNDAGCFDIELLLTITKGNGELDEANSQF